MVENPLAYMAYMIWNLSWYINLLVLAVVLANSKFDLKIKEAWHINWRKPNLNAQQNHLALTLSL